MAFEAPSSIVFCGFRELRFDEYFPGLTEAVSTGLQADAPYTIS
jgi:hypothetical protein